MLVFWPKIHATINVDKSNAISKEKMCIEIDWNRSGSKFDNSKVKRRKLPRNIKTQSKKIETI